MSALPAGGRRSAGPQDSVEHVQSAIGGTGDDDIVGDHDDRLAPVPGVAEQIDHRRAGGTVERTGWLVGEHDGRPRDQCPGDRHALLLAA